MLCEKCFSASAKGIDQVQPVQSDLGQNLLLLVNFVHDKSPAYPHIQSVVIQKAIFILYKNGYGSLL